MRRSSKKATDGKNQAVDKIRATSEKVRVASSSNDS